jgi:NAD(P)-dependent dehydrogenase (short-subunit alcohol dehydrogenase family)
MKTIVVTGAAGGIGRALVDMFDSAGFNVIGIDKSAYPAKDQRLQKYVSADLERFAVDDNYRGQILSDLKGLISADGLVGLINNAAIQELGGVNSLGVAEWQRTLNVNLLAPFFMTQGLLPRLAAAGGCVVNISSIHARLTKPNFVAYATSKAALSGMTRAMAVDLGGRVRVNAIEPAAIATSMLKAGFKDNPEEYAKLEQCHPLGRIGTPEEVAALALSIVDGDLKFLHGACVGLDGGIGARLHDPA